MIIDFHTHIFPDKIAEKTIAKLASVANIAASTDGTINGLVESMNRANVDISVIQPVVTKPEQFETINQFAQSINEKYKGDILYLLLRRDYCMPRPPV